MRIGILKADSVREEFQSEFGDYQCMFQRVLDSVARSALEYRTYDVLAGDYPESIDECDGYVITGSRESVYDEQDWIRRLGDFVIALHEQQKRTVGICFGHQLIAHVLGGETTPAVRGWGVGVHEFRVEDAPPWMSGKLGSFRLLCSHRDQVARLPRDARVFATSDFCPVAGYTLGEHFVTFQGHPEFLKPYAEILMQSRKELLESAYDKGIASLAETTDEGLVATWMLEFFEQ